MIRYLLLLQFPLLCVTALIAGVGAFWVDRYIGRLYFATPLLLGGLHLLLQRRRVRLSGLPTAIPLLLAGTAAAIWAYRPLHLGSWDVSSGWQLARLAALGVSSLLASHLATELRPGSRHALAPALALVALLWLPALEFPLMPLLFAGLIQAAALAFLPPRATEPLPAVTRIDSGRLAGLARYGVFLAALTLGETIMDYQEDTRWATHVVITLLAAALAALLVRGRPGSVVVAAVTLGIATYLATALFPDFVLHPAHAAGAGLALGAALAYLDRLGAGALIGPTAYWAFGLALSFGLARHLTIGGWRAVLLIPGLILLMNLYRSGRATAESS